MGSAYTPGLTVSANTVIRKNRRLPIKGETLVQVGADVNPDDVVARALLPGILQSVKLSEQLGVSPSEVHEYLLIKVGDEVQQDQTIAQTKGFFGLFKSAIVSPVTGTVESVSEVSGHLQVREPATPVERTAYIRGKVVEVTPMEGAVVETNGALIQGIFGIGGERLGEILIVGDENLTTLDAENLNESMKGKIVVCAGGITGSALRKAHDLGIVGLVVASMKNDLELKDYLGYDIGVAITGQENIPLTLILTEGFGTIRMADRTFKLLRSLEGKQASINGATQIRAGVMRPEVIVPTTDAVTSTAPADDSFELKNGTLIRVIREPYFGRLGKVTDLPAELVVVESGTHVRVLEAELDDGQRVIVPRANVEIIAG